MTRPLTVLTWLPCWLLLLAAFHSTGGTVHANGATKELVRNERAGPYELRVGMFPGTPRVGNLHLSIQVKDAERGELLTRGVVIVTAKGPEGTADVAPIRAVTSPDSPQFYDADIPMDVVGRWNLTLYIEGELGDAALKVPLDVLEAEGFNLVFVLAAAVAFLALGIWTWDRVRVKRRRRGQKA